MCRRKLWIPNEKYHPLFCKFHYLNGALFIIQRIIKSDIINVVSVTMLFYYDISIYWSLMESTLLLEICA